LEYNYQYCKVTHELALTLTNGTDTLELKPVEALDSIVSGLSVVVPPNAIGNGAGWEVAGLSGITNANGTSAEDFSFSEIDINYTYAPVFGAITTDKESYNGLETVHIAIPVTNAELADEPEYDYTFADYLEDNLALSIDGGQSFIEKNLLTWDPDNKCVKASFAAPNNTGDSPMQIAAELYEGYGEIISYRALLGAFKIIQIDPEAAAFVPVMGITVTGMPATGAIKTENMGLPYSLTVAVSPGDATFQGYTWASSVPSRAHVEGNTLYFTDEGAVTLTLTSTEIAYRIEEGLPPNDAVLEQRFTFLVGDMEPRLIASSESVGYGTNVDQVTACFYDNFKVLDGAWDDAVFTYEIFAAGALSASKSGTVSRIGEGGQNGATMVTLAFDGTTPKTVSAYEDGEYRPAYNIVLSASSGGQYVSATSAVYIMPPPVLIERISETATFVAGQQAAIDFKISNLVPGYSATYNILYTGETNTGTLTESNIVTDPVTGLTSMIGSVSYTPQTQDSSAYHVIYVTATNPGGQSQFYAGYIDVANPAPSNIILTLYDGLDGTPIASEPGDAAGVYYGLRESRLAQIIGDSEASQQEAYDYLNRMMRAKGLNVRVPGTWGSMQAAGGGQTYWNKAAGNALHLSASDSGIPVSLSWENVPTTMPFTFMEDDLAGKVFVFQLKDALAAPVSINYTNEAGDVVEKEITPYNGAIILYEPNGIGSQVWMAQEGGAGNLRFATAAPDQYQLRKSSDSVWGGNGYESLVVVQNHALPVGSASALPFNTVSVTMQANPAAKFASVGTYRPTAVNYGLIDESGAFIAGTGGQTADITNGVFQLPINALFEKPGARLAVEFVYNTPAYGATTQMETYDLQTLYDKLRLGKTTAYNLSRNTVIQSATITGADGVQNMAAGTNTKTIQRDDVVEVRVATKDLVIAAASLDLRLFEPSIHGDWYERTDSIATVPAYELFTLEYGFAEGSYTVLRFKPGLAAYMQTPGDFVEVGLKAADEAGTGVSDRLLNLGYLRLEDNGETAANIAKITEVLEGLTFIHEDQMQLSVGDADVLGNVRALRGSLSVFNEKIAEVIDKMEMDLAIPSQNPYTFYVERKGDEYIIRGYVHKLIMNQAGWVNLAQQWYGPDHMSVFNEIKEKINVNFVLDGVYYKDWADGFKYFDRAAYFFGSFPGICGYIEGKAYIAPDGNPVITLDEGLTLVQSRAEYFPTDEFDLYGYWKYKIGFEGNLNTTLELTAPDKETGPSSPQNFNMNAYNDISFSFLKGDNGMDLELGIFSQKSRVHGGIEASYYENSVYRPYATNSADQITRTVRFVTSGDFYSSYSMRVVTLDDYISESKSRPIWYTVKRGPISEGGWVYQERHEFEKSYPDSARLSALAASPSLLQTPATAALAIPADAAAFGGVAALSGGDVMRTARYAHNGGLIYQDGNGAVVTADGGGANPVTVDSVGFGLDSASAGGKTFAAWGAYNGEYDPSVLDTFDTTAMLNYAAGMTEIKAGIWDGSAWNTSVLTDNALADITPKAATNGTQGIIVWTQGIPAASADGDELAFSMGESRLMFARYDSSAWSKPAVLYTLPGEAAADYTVAMDQDGNALAAIITASGKIVLVRAPEDGTAAVIDNGLPAATRTSLLYNGEAYILACYDVESLALSLFELNADGFVTGTVFSGLPEGIGGELKLLRDGSKSGIESAVLLWPGSIADDADTPADASDDTAEVVMYAARMMRAEDKRASLSAPFKAVSVNDEVFADSYDAYINGDSIKVLTVFSGLDGSTALDETTASFTNTVSTSAEAKDISGLVPGSSVDFSVRVRNNGISAIDNITVKIGGVEAASRTVQILPNGEASFTAPFTLTQSLPDDIAYTVTAAFADGGTDTADGSIPLQKTDIAAELSYYERTDNELIIEALISNNMAFSLEDKSVVAGIYSDPFGTTPIAEKTINGEGFTRDGSGVPALVGFTLADADSLLGPLYLAAKVYNSDSREVYDSVGSNNVRMLTVNIPAYAAPDTPATPTYTVTWNGNGGTPSEASRQVNAGAAVGTLPTATRSSHTLSGWYTAASGGTQITASTVIGGNVTYYAQWTQDSTGGGSSGGGPSTTPTPAPTPTKPPDVPLGDYVPFDNPFSDINDGAWYYYDAIFAYTHGLMVGTNDNPVMFSPQMSMSRSMIVTVLYRMAGRPATSSANPFSDVASGTWYTDAVEWAAANKIVSGIGGGKFGPDGAVTRQDLAVILDNYAEAMGLKLPITRNYPGFKDEADIANYALEAIERFFEAGIINGRPGEIFDPKGTATRAEAAAMLHRFLESIEDEIPIANPDTGAGIPTAGK
jgi:uncharacterized repeat protein (TIGR02543 family)